MEIIGHRGASFDAPENTLSAFKLGFQQQADADELDVHLTQDGRVVVIHDGDTGRVSGVMEEVATQRLEELRRLEVGQWGRWKGKGFSERIPLLEEVVAIVPAGKRLFIEIKCGAEVLAELGRVLRQGGQRARQSVLIGFDYETMRQAKAQLPQHEVCWLASGDRKTRRYPLVERLIEPAKAAGLDGLDLEAGFPIDGDFVQAVHRAGLRLYTWTVDEAAVALKHAVAGVDGVTTNRPGWVRERLVAGE